MADQAIFEINIAGINVSERFNPILEGIEVTAKSGATSDTARITLADEGGRIIMPQKQDPVTILLGWASSGPGLVFEGTVDDVRSTGSRGGGRILSIGAKGFDAHGKAKEPLELHKDNATLQDFLSAAAQKAGLSGARVAASLASIRRDYWSATNESFIALGRRIANEVGGTFKIVGTMAIMAERSGGQSASGQPLPIVTAQLGVNLINWDISPILSRPRYGSSRVRWYDVTQAKWREIDVDVDQPGGAPAKHTHRYPRADEGEAKDAARSNKKASERNRGEGHVLILGEPAAQPEGVCMVMGARPGIDGAYRIEQVRHKLSRGGGFQTQLSLKQPEGGAGSDKR